MTSSPSLLRLLRDDPRAAELATWPFDFEPGPAGDGRITHVEPVRLASGEPLEAIAKDGGGGTYFLCGSGDGEDRPVLFADSEGSAGIVGADLRAALLLIAALPCAGQAVNLERQGHVMDETALAALRQEEDDELSEAAGMEDLPERRAEFLDRLGLVPPPLTDLLVLAREAAALDSSHVLLNEHGDAYRQD
ncbi:hypothetical protein ABZ930_18620 [Streptomyces sp. NPDC046716]|uniref:hypothetical protein n=1 Tax=Streptomyces sp. NPDC046716 TaxID=3157093 RepID=UPI0033E1E1BF